MKNEQFYRRGTALLLTAVMVVLLCTACGNGEEESAADPVTFSFYNADGEEDPWTDPVAQLITKKTGVTLTTDYPVDGTNSKISLMIASGEYPDIIFAKGDGVTLIEAGALLDLTDLIEEYGPNIKKLYGENYSRLKYSEEDPSIYQLASNPVDTSLYTSSGTAQLQWAVLAYNNYEIPYTLEQYEDRIKSYLAAYPEINGKATLGLSISCSDWRWYITLANPSGFINGFPDNGQWVVDDDNNYLTVYKHASAGQYEYFKWLNRMYSEGILDPEFATQRHEDYMAKISEGRVLGLLDALWDYNEAEMILKANGEYERTYAGLPVTMSEEVVCTSLYSQGLQAGWGVAVTKSCEDPVRAVQFLNWMCSEEAQILLNWGLENVNYILDENGMRKLPDDELLEKKTDTLYATRTGVGYHLYPFPRYGDGVKDSAGDYFTTTSRQAVIDSYNEEEKKALEAWNVEMLVDIFPSAESFESISPYGSVYQWSRPRELLETEAVLDAISNEYLVKAIICNPERFDVIWEEFQQKLKSAGLETINRRMTELVQQRVEFWAQ